jgi:hypothetical protein
MTHAMNVHDGTGVLIQVPGVGIMLAYGTTVPADATVGYAIGCLFIHTDGGAGTALYCNEGTAASADFDAVTVA